MEEEDREMEDLCKLQIEQNIEESLSGDEEGEIDFVLVWVEKPSDPNWSINKRKREIFLENLAQEGLLIEEGKCVVGNNLKFMKIFAPLEVLRRYAEILKIRMPIKRFSTLLLHSESAEGDDMLEFKLTQTEGADEEIDHTIKIPLFSDVHHGLKSWLEKIQEPFYPSKELFPEDRLQSQYTATYSRDKDYLFDDNHPKFFSPATRSRIVEFLLKRKRFTEDSDDDFSFGITKLISDGAAIACYPLHDGSIDTPGSQRKLLNDEWASIRNFWKYQPLDAIRDYYGVKMGLYFAWLGFYTSMLIPPSIVGVVCFVYGLSTFSTDVPSDDICEGPMKNTTMCPICDELQEACTMTKAKYLFDNATTVAFAVFMSIWAVIFTELWKRSSAEITHRWDVFGYDPEEEHPRPEYLAKLTDVKEKRINFVTQTREPWPPFWEMKVPGVLISWSSVLFFIFLALITVLAIILYRMSMVVALATVSDNTIKSNWSLFISMTGAGINLVLILIFNYIYEAMAVWLTEKELHRTQTDFDNALTLKIYLFQFVNYYASIFYIAFFKGLFVGTPNKYTRVLNWRQEECSPGGCFVELSIQLAIIFMGKQFFLSIMEYYLPHLWRLINWIKIRGWNLYSKDPSERTAQYVKDFQLAEWGHQALFYEYLEMVIQYGFITIFVCAFPLAPFFALCNNILELRLDAKKIHLLHRRPIAEKVQNIGVWLEIMETLGRISIITNAFIIAMTSEFIPKMVYRYFYSGDGSLNGYVDFSLSYFDMRDFDQISKMSFTADDKSSTANTSEICRYPGYQSPPDSENPYTNNLQFWHIWFARLLFVVVFENLVAVTVLMLNVAIPDISSDLKYKIRREEYITKEIIIRTERMRKAWKDRPSESHPDLRKSHTVIPLARSNSHDHDLT